MQCLSAQLNFKVDQLPDFVVSAVQDAAQQAIQQVEVIRLSMRDQRSIADALLAPAKPNAALERALARRQKLLLQAQ